MQTEFDKDLLSYFTDVEQLQNDFKHLVTAPTLTKHLFVIRGDGAIGKSSLLRMFRLSCKDAHVPVALASGDEEKSGLDVLARWMEDLNADGVAFPTFGKKFDHYRKIQTKVDEQTKKAQIVHSRVADIATKAVSKTAEVAGGGLAGAAIGSVIPGVGTAIGGVLGSALGGVGAEALVDWLRGFLKHSDIQLLLDASKELGEDFLADLAEAAENQRIVLMLDTFEQMSALENWARNVAQRSHANALLVIAGRDWPNWTREWQDWMACAQIEELKPMNEDVMRDLARRYYATINVGEPQPAQVEAIVRFARGLPMVVTGAMQLWVKYGVEDFQSVKPEVVANLVDRLTEGVPKSLIPALEAAAVVRFFDQPILRAVTELKDVRQEYDELRRFPFVRVRTEGWALHDSVREIMDENVRVQDPERHRELHKRAAVYFENRLKEATGDEAERLELERLYHRVREDEEAGIKLFQGMAEEFARYLFVNRLRVLVNDVNTYPHLSQSSQLWREYYNARLAHISVHFSDAEKTYISVSQNELADRKVRAYALCDLAQLWTRNYRLAEPGGLDRALSAIEQSRRLVPEMDSKLARSFSHLRYAYMFKGELENAVKALSQQYDYYRGIEDKYGAIYSLDMQKDLYGLLGNWKLAGNAEDDGLKILDSLPPNLYFRARLRGHNIWYKIWSGHYSEAERGIRQALDLAEEEAQIEGFPGLFRDLGLVLGLQRRWKESQEYFSKSVKSYEERDYKSTGLGSTLGEWGAVLVKMHELKQAGEYLESSFSLKKELQDNNGIPEVLAWSGELYEVKAKDAKDRERNDYLSQAESFYSQCLEYQWTSRRYFECAALAGLMRVKYSGHNYEEAARLSSKAEQIARAYCFHDLLASFYLYKGHLEWSYSDETRPSGFDAAILSYKRAMLHALSYNRFCLDEVVWGDRVSTPLLTIVSQCSSRGSEGEKMVEALTNWWNTDTDHLKLASCNEGISPEISSTPLAQAEILARQREPGDGTVQSSLTDVFSRFLA